MKTYCKSLGLACACWMLLFATPGYAQEAPEMRVGYIEFPPMYSTVDGKPEGLLLDITRPVLAELGYRYQEKSYPARRLFANLAQGWTDLWYGIRIEKLMQDVIIGNQPIVHITLNAYALTPEIEIRHEFDLIGKKVILMRGYSYSDWGTFIRAHDNGVLFAEVNSHEEALRLLQSGKFDYLLDYRYPVEMTLKTHPVPGINHKTLSRLPVFFNVSRRHPQAEQLVEQLDATFLRLATAGRYPDLDPTEYR